MLVHACMLNIRKRVLIPRTCLLSKQFWSKERYLAYCAMELSRYIRMIMSASESSVSCLYKKVDMLNLT